MILRASNDEYKSHLAVSATSTRYGLGAELATAITRELGVCCLGMAVFSNCKASKIMRVILRLYLCYISISTTQLKVCNIVLALLIPSTVYSCPMAHLLLPSGQDVNLIALQLAWRARLVSDGASRSVHSLVPHVLPAW